MEAIFRTAWISIWTKPRETIWNIVDTNPYRYVILLAMIAGIGEALDKASENSTGDNSSLIAILIMALILGPLGGILSIYISGVLLRWTGVWIGGNARQYEIRAAIAWSSIIGIWLMALWIPELLLFGKELFTTKTPIIDSSTSLTILFEFFNIVKIVFGIWAAIVYLKCLGEVQGFSAWKALGNTMLAGLFILVPALVIIVVIMLVAA